MDNKDKKGANPAETNTSFVIEADTVVQSNKPRHTEERFSQGVARSREASMSGGAEAKRKEIIEARQQKLAQKSLYVQEVIEQQRKKLQQKSNEISENINKSLENAAKNRTLIIQNLVTAASENVKQAKEKASMNNQNFQSKLRERREKMAEKQRIADRKRRQLLKIPRSSQYFDQEFKVDEDLNIVPSDAALTIQTSWRIACLRKPLRNFRILNFCLDTAKILPFEELAGKINDSLVMKATADILNILLRADKIRRKLKNSTRTFLSAYLIHIHAPHILTHNDETENRLKESAFKTIDAFETLIYTFRTSAIHKNADAFIDQFNIFYSDFNDWKANDKSKYVDELVQHYLDLEVLWTSVSTQVDAETQWKPKIDTEKQRLRAEINKTGGKAALEKLDSAVKAYLEQNQGSAPSPVAAASSPSVANSKIKSPEIKRKETAPKVPAEPVREEWKDLIGSFNSSAERTNEQMAHELFMDPQFELSNKSEDEQTERIKNIAKKAFFDSVKEEFDKGNYLQWTPILLQDVKTQLLSMLPEKSHLASTVDQGLDIELIKQQITHKVFETDKCIKFVVSVIKQMCAPIRDAQVKAIENMDQNDLTSIFKEILELLDLMRLDLANFRLTVLRPKLKEHIVKYEQEKFEQALTQKKITLEKTEKWLSDIIQSIQETAAARNPENIQLPEASAPTSLPSNYLSDIYNEALMSLITSATPCIGPNCPETFELDERRMVNYQNECQAITIVASLIMLLKNAFPEFKRDSSALEKLSKNLFLLLEDPETKLENLQVQLVDTVRASRKAKLEFYAQHASSSAAAANSNTAEITAEETELINNMVSKTLSSKDRVFLIVQRRIASVIKSYLSSGKFKKESLPSHGLDLVGEELFLFSEKVLRLAKHNREVYAPWYDKLIMDKKSKA